MPVNDIIKHAIDNNPLRVKDAFDQEMKGRVRDALNAKYQEMTSDEEPAVDAVDEIPETPDLEASADDGVVEESVEETTEEETEEE